MPTKELKNKGSTTRRERFFSEIMKCSGNISHKKLYFCIG